MHFTEDNNQYSCIKGSATSLGTDDDSAFQPGNVCSFTTDNSGTESGMSKCQLGVDTSKVLIRHIKPLISLPCTKLGLISKLLTNVS